MSTKNLIKAYIILIFFLIKNECLYVPSGMNSLNNFIYLTRLYKFYKQSIAKSCSLTDASNCYFTENNYIKNIPLSNIDSIINNDWIKIYSQMEDYDYEELLYELTNKTSNYIDLYTNSNDTEQHPDSDKLSIIMTFDDETTKPEMYLDQLTGIFYNEKLVANFEGKLKLSNKYQEKPKTNKISNFPSKLYGIIESEFVTISFQGKLFLFVSVYIRAHAEENKSDNINFYGYLGNKIVYAYSYTDQSRKDRNWLKVLSHTNLLADKLIISGPYDIDNIEFTFEYETNIEISEIVSMNIDKKTFKLINDDEI